MVERALRRAQSGAQVRRARAWRWESVLVCCVAAAACGSAGGVSATLGAIEPARASSGQAGAEGAGRGGVDAASRKGPRGTTPSHIAAARHETAGGLEEESSAKVRAGWDDNGGVLESLSTFSKDPNRRRPSRRSASETDDDGFSKDEKEEQDDDDSVRATTPFTYPRPWTCLFPATLVDKCEERGRPRSRA